MNNDSAPHVSEKELAEWDALCEKATSGPWSYESYPSGSRAVSFNYPTTGPFGSPKSPDRVHRHIQEVRQQLCDCCPENALHWVGADHDDQEEYDLRFTAAARTALPRLITALITARQREQTAVGLLLSIDTAQEQWQVDESLSAIKDFLAAIEARALPIPGMSMPPETQALSDAFDKWAEDSRNNPQRIGTIEAREKEVEV